MTAPNHALTGAIIGLSISNPFFALPLAFLSHFLCDAIPHYDPAESDMRKLFRSKRFVIEFLAVGASLCFAIVLTLAIVRPQNWEQAAVCAFLAASPDLFWFPWYVRIRKGADIILPKGWFFWFHDKVQWKTGPKLIWIEITWAVGCCTMLSRLLW